MTTNTRPAIDYTPWHDTVTAWDSPAAFAAAGGWVDGVHTINLGDGPALDLLIVGQPFDMPVIPVFFNGAVTARGEKTGPFFSGSRLAAKAGFGFIAISDPSLGLHQSLGLAWYAGNRYSNVQDQITETLAGIAAQSGRELLLIGGSGGGFASLYYGGRLNDVASAMVWNPQTEIRRYNKWYVDNYMQHAWGEECAAGTSVVGSLPKRVLYWQNANDWHVAGHAQPYMAAAGFNHQGRGVYESGPDKVVCFAAYGEGHAGLPEKPMITAIRRLLDPNVTASHALDTAIAKHAFGWEAPEWVFRDKVYLEVPEVALLIARES